MNAQTIAEAKVHTSLWDFLLALPGTMEAQIFYALALGCALGTILHYTKQWLTQEASGSLWDYLFIQHPKRTAMAIFTVLSWSAGEVATGLFVTGDGVFVGWALVILSGLKTGYLGDSIVNKGNAGEPPTQPNPAALAAQQGAGK